ncbi:hypothetical protein HDV02_005353 [Globomyces sp. JEL0801]|nr:hypothetical protein HDV02_005353 [Globomyces sp. JEL0801]
MTILFLLTAVTAKFVISDLKVSSVQPEGFTGARFNSAMKPFIPNIQGEKELADNLTEGIPGPTLGLYAAYTVFDVGNPSQQVVIDASFVSSNCPNGYENMGVIPGSKKCRTFNLCVKKMSANKLTNLDSFITGAFISKNKKDTAIDERAAPNPYISIVDREDFHGSCGDDNNYYVGLERDAAYPKDLNQLNPQEKRDLMVNYAPLIVLHPKEDWWPASVSNLLDNSIRTFKDGNWQLHTKIPLPNDYNFNNPYWHGNSDLSSVPMYAFFIEKQQGIIDLVYSTYYPFNYGKKIPVAFNTVFGNHIGDVEYMAIRFINGAPSTVFNGFHSWTHTNYFYGNTLAKAGNQIKFYSAMGSHGLWSTTGKHEYKQAALGLIKLVDETGDGKVWNGRNKLEAFDVKRKLPLPGNTEFTFWPQILESDGVNDPNRGTSDSRSGPVERWGQQDTKGCVFGQCRIENAPSGFAQKGWWNSFIAV